VLVKLQNRLNSVDLLTKEDRKENLQFQIEQLRDKLICLQDTLRLVPSGSQYELYYKAFIQQVKYSIGDLKAQINQLEQ